MNTKETSQENVRILVKLGIDVEDIANIYLNITKKGEDIEKDAYVNNLTKMLKFFQTRNININDQETEAIYKEDVLKMIKKNRKLVGLDINKKIKPICEKLDSYYFMNPGHTNKLIKNNPNIFNINKIDLEIYSTVLSDFGIKTDSGIVNLFEYILKQKNEFLQNDVKNVYQRILFIRDSKKSKLINEDELEKIQQDKFEYKNNVISVEALNEMYQFPSYKGEGITKYKEKILEHIK